MKFTKALEKAFEGSKISIKGTNIKYGVEKTFGSETIFCVVLSNGTLAAEYITSNFFKKEWEVVD